MKKCIALLILSSSVVSQTSKQDPPLDGNEYLGNCLTQKHDFSDKQRIFQLGGLDAYRDIKELDSGRYDFTIDYHENLVSYPGPTGIELSIVPPSDPNADSFDAPRVSTTRYMRYGKISTRMKVPAIHGIVTTFVIMGPNLPDPQVKRSDEPSGDEIDWEIVGYDPEHPQTNIFYRGIPETTGRSVHQNFPKGGRVDEYHTYSIDWRSDRIIFSIDDIEVRTYFKNSKEADSPNTPNKFFPDRAGKVAFALWSRAKDDPSAWSGGPVQWPDPNNKKASAIYDYIDIQCYDDNDRPVPKWPLRPQNVDRMKTAKNQPTSGRFGTITVSAGYGGDKMTEGNFLIKLDPSGGPTDPGLSPVDALPKPQSGSTAVNALGFGFLLSVLVTLRFIV